jgi:hypothetical protein
MHERVCLSAFKRTLTPYNCECANPAEANEDLTFLGYLDEIHSSVVARAVVHSAHGQIARSLSHV